LAAGDVFAAEGVSVLKFHQKFTRIRPFPPLIHPFPLVIAFMDAYFCKKKERHE